MRHSADSAPAGSSRQCQAPGRGPAEPPRGLSRPGATAAALVLLVIVAAVFRCHNLDYAGFSEDEVAKVQAIRGYARGDWSANAEHPMLMKALMAASSSGASMWNRLASGVGWARLSPEAALRLPNALAGAAAVVPLFLLARSLFGPGIALVACWLLAVDVNVTGINRIGKEDTLFVFFLLLGWWLYEEARTRHLRHGVTPDPWYASSGAAFGLMLASKYLLYYLGIWAVAGIVASAEARRVHGQGSATRQRASKWFYLGALGAFLAANPAVLLPETWRYLLAYLHGGTITHHGAFFAGRVYMNMTETTPWGLPWHFYLTYLATKTPLPVLAAMVVGLVELVRRRRERGAVFARVFLVLFLLPGSLLAGKFVRYLLPTLVVLEIVAALGVIRGWELIVGPRRLGARAVAAAAIMLGSPLLAQITAGPYPSLHLNAIGRRVAAPGGLFPNDELYDIGVRESVEWVAQRAGPGASIASDAPGVVAEYLRRYRRPDIEARSLSTVGVAPPPTESWLLAQNSHLCFESVETVKQVRRRQQPDFVVRVRGTAAVETYRLPW
jgi:hypothetical protein